MSKKSITKKLQIITVVVTAAVLVGAYTMKGDRSFDELSDSVESMDIATRDTAPSSDILILKDTETDTDTAEDKDTETAHSSDTDTDTLSDSDINSDTDSGRDSDIHSDSDRNSDEDTDEEYKTIFPYRGVWNLIVVNKYNPIPEDYYFTLAALENGKQVDSRIYDDLQEMLSDMAAAGLHSVVGEAYRTDEDQEKIMQDYISAYVGEGYTQEKAETEAKKWVALPGTSEHQLGLALDINANVEYSSNEAVYGWLAENAYKYGFILRYPQGKEKITGIDYEPWHYRYVGRIAAEEIYNSKKCLEEYLEE